MLEALDLECERGGRRLLGGLSLGLSAGELLRVAGANGSGKTSLLRVLCGLLTPSAGEVRWNGKAIGSLREEYWERLLYLGHAPAVKEDLTAAENLEVAARISGLKASAAEIREALRRYGVPGGLLRRMSQGQRRRAALARLLLAGALPLWLLDEPFTALDKPASELTEQLVRSHVEKGGMVVYTTHHDVNLPGGKVIQLDA